MDEVQEAEEEDLLFDDAYEKRVERAREIRLKEVVRRRDELQLEEKISNAEVVKTINDAGSVEEDLQDLEDIEMKNAVDMDNDADEAEYEVRKRLYELTARDSWFINCL